MFTQTTHVWLNHNHIGDEGCKALAEAMVAEPPTGCSPAGLPKLEKLYLNDNQIGDEGVSALADKIFFEPEKTCWLRHIYLANNKITKAGRDKLDRAVAKRGRIQVHYDDARPPSPGP